MQGAEHRSGDQCAVYVDTGTTNTRVWLVYRGEVIARASASIGVRDTARDGSPKRLHATLCELIGQVRGEGGKRDKRYSPSCVIGAGMLTSSLGLMEVPHLEAPAGYDELSAGIRQVSATHITDLPILLVPGVRSGGLRSSISEIGGADVMRGEEALCMGLVSSGRMEANGTLINLGSHWKVIKLDDQCRIESSRTSLAGEMIHAVQTETILSSSVPRERPSTLELDWCDAGMAVERREGVARALFCVRLLDQRTSGSPEQRMSFLIGAFVAADLDVLLEGGHLRPNELLTIVGVGAIADAWQLALSKSSIRADVISVSEAELAVLRGLEWLVQARGVAAQ